MSIKVLHVYRTYFPDSQGGLEEVIRQIALNSAESAVTRIFSLSAAVSNVEKHKCEVSGAEVIRAPLWFEVASCGFFYKGLSEFHRQCKWADVVHYHFPWPFADILDLAIARRLRKKTVITYHSDVVRQKGLNFFYQALKLNFLTNADRIVATSPNYLSSSPTLTRFSHKVDVISLGINEESYPVADEARVAYWQEKVGEPFILFVGVLRYYKGLDILLDAMKTVQFPLVIAGDGIEMNALKQKAADLNLEHVHFLGYISDEDKVALLQACRAFILPSNQRSEAFGVSLLEAAMFAKPLISVEIGTGTSYANIQNETGLVVSAGSPDALADAMSYMIANENAAVAMGKAALVRFKQLFTGKEMGRAYSDLYLSLTSYKLG